MLFSILNIFFDLLIIVLLIRFFVERYQFYGFGPIMVTIIRLAELALRPLRERLPQSALSLRDQVPLAAIVIALFLRGLVIWIVGPSLSYTYPILQTASGSATLLGAMSASFTMGVVLVGVMILAFLFASWMISQSGINLYSNGAFVCFKEKTFAVFRLAQKLAKTDRLSALFCISAAVILLATGILAGLTSVSFTWGAHIFQVTVWVAIFDVLMMLLNLYWFVLLLAILASWISADQYSTVIQVVRCMAEPYLMIFRRLCPWARIDFVDLSPIFAFLFLNPILVYCLSYIKITLFRWIAPHW